VKGQETKLNVSYLSHSLCYPACCECKGVSLLPGLCEFPQRNRSSSKS